MPANRTKEAFSAHVEEIHLQVQKDTLMQKATLSGGARMDVSYQSAPHGPSVATVKMDRFAATEYGANLTKYLSPSESSLQKVDPKYQEAAKKALTDMLSTTQEQAAKNAAVIAILKKENVTVNIV